MKVSISAQLLAQYLATSCALDCRRLYISSVAIYPQSYSHLSVQEVASGSGERGQVAPGRAPDDCRFKVASVGVNHLVPTGFSGASDSPENLDLQLRPVLHASRLKRLTLSGLLSSVLSRKYVLFWRVAWVSGQGAATSHSRAMARSGNAGRAAKTPPKVNSLFPRQDTRFPTYRYPKKDAHPPRKSVARVTAWYAPPLNLTGC